LNIRLPHATQKSQSMGAFVIDCFGCNGFGGKFGLPPLSGAPFSVFGPE
jgi:hypothetical protein